MTISAASFNIFYYHFHTHTPSPSPDLHTFHSFPHLPPLPVPPTSPTCLPSPLPLAAGLTLSLRNMLSPQPVTPFLFFLLLNFLLPVASSETSPTRSRQGCLSLLLLQTFWEERDCYCLGNQCSSAPVLFNHGIMAPWPG